MKYVILESPFAGETALNVDYARRALEDSIDRGECPFAGHLLYPQVLDDTDPNDRDVGIRLHLLMAEIMFRGTDLPKKDGVHTLLMAAYIDRGISPGMREALIWANRNGVPFEFRSLTP